MDKRNEKMGKGTTNYAPDSHKKFCERCLKQYNKGICPLTGKSYPSSRCSI